MRYVRTMSDTATIVYRDEFDPQYDFGHWTIRDDEVRPLHELLGSLLAAVDSPAEPEIIMYGDGGAGLQREINWLTAGVDSPQASLPDSVRALQRWLHRAAAEVNEGNEDLYDALERSAYQLCALLDVLNHYLSDSVKGPAVRESVSAPPITFTDAQQHLVDEMVRGLRSRGIKVDIKLVQFLKTYAQRQEG